MAATFEDAAVLFDDQIATFDGELFTAAHLAAILAFMEANLAIWDEVIDGGLTAKQMLRIMGAALAGKVSGAGTGTETFRDVGDTENRIVATVDAVGNRTAITLDGGA